MNILWIGRSLIVYAASKTVSCQVADTRRLSVTLVIGKPYFIHLNGAGAQRIAGSKWCLSYAWPDRWIGDEKSARFTISYKARLPDDTLLTLDRG